MEEKEKRKFEEMKKKICDELPERVYKNIKENKDKKLA